MPTPTPAGQPLPPKRERRTILPRASPSVGMRSSSSQRVRDDSMCSQTSWLNHGELSSGLTDMTTVSERPDGESRNASVVAMISEKAAFWGQMPWYAARERQT